MFTFAISSHDEFLVKNDTLLYWEKGILKSFHLFSTHHPVLQQLHWLQVRQGVEFKLAVLVYKVVNNLAPPYLSDDCRLVATTGRRQLRSSDNFKCTFHLIVAVHVLEIEHSLLPDHAFGTVFLRTAHTATHHGTRSPGPKFTKFGE